MVALEATCSAAVVLANSFWKTSISLILCLHPGCGPVTALTGRPLVLAAAAWGAGIVGGICVPSLLQVGVLWVHSTG